MIYTITFNPSLDYIMHVDCFEEGKQTVQSKKKFILRKRDSMFQQF